MELDTLYEVIDVQLFPNGEQVLNVYFYRDTVGDGSAEDISLAFNNDIVNLLKIVQSNQFTHQMIKARSLGDPADVYERTLVAAVGSVVADCLPPFNAVNFTLRPSTRAVRPGSKRIGGLPDTNSWYTNGVVTEAVTLTNMENIRAALHGVIDAAGTDYEPVIVKRIPYVTAGGRDAYRLPVNDAEALYYDVATCLFNPRISHQVSRGNS